MKFSILFLPALLEIALVIALHAQTPFGSPLTLSRRDAEIRELRAELKSIAARLDALEAQGREFLPRAYATTPSTSRGHPRLRPASISATAITRSAISRARVAGAMHA